MPRGYGSSRSFSPGANTRERAAQSNRFSGGGYRSTTTRTRPTPTRSKPKFSFKPIAVKVIEGLTSSFKKSKQNVMDYEGQAAGVTPMRNPFPTRGGGNDQDPQYKPTTIIKPTLISPTTAEVSQATATTAEAPITTPEEIAETEEERKRKTKRRGRSLTILTGSTGVTSGLTLGKPSLLGS
jgi:hypothetical protein